MRRGTKTSLTICLVAVAVVAVIQANRSTSSPFLVQSDSSIAISYSAHGSDYYIWLCKNGTSTSYRRAWQSGRAEFRSGVLTESQWARLEKTLSPTTLIVDKKYDTEPPQDMKMAYEENHAVISVRNKTVKFTQRVHPYYFRVGVLREMNTAVDRAVHALELREEKDAFLLIPVLGDVSSQDIRRPPDSLLEILTEAAKEPHAWHPLNELQQVAGELPQIYRIGDANYKVALTKNREI